MEKDDLALLQQVIISLNTIPLAGKSLQLAMVNCVVALDNIRDKYLPKGGDGDGVSAKGDMV